MIEKRVLTDCLKQRKILCCVFQRSIIFLSFRTQADFGDGGAYPECIVVQYPMMMGSKKQSNSSNQPNAVALQYDSEGNVKYDAILKTGHRDDKIIHTGLY